MIDRTTLLATMTAQFLAGVSSRSAADNLSDRVIANYARLAERVLDAVSGAGAGLSPEDADWLASGLVERGYDAVVRGSTVVVVGRRV